MKSLDEMIAVMEASKTKEIEFRHKGIPEDQWDVVKIQSWDWSTFDYRVKAQEPRRMVGLENEKYPLVAAYPNLSSALRNFGEASENPKSATSVEFIELTPDVKSRLGLI